MPTGASTGTRACAQARGTWRALALAVLLLAAALVAHAPAALALTAIEINNDADRIEITAQGEAYEARGDALQIETAPGADGVRGRMSVRAATPGTNPAWFVFALTNTTDKPIERWLVADRYGTVGSAWCGPISTRGASMPSPRPSALCPSASRTTAPTCSA